DPRHGGARRGGGADAVGRDRRARPARVRARAGRRALSRTAGRAHRARRRDPPPARHRRVEPRNRQAALHQRADGEEPRAEHLPEAPGERPDEGGAPGDEARARRQVAPMSPRLRATLRWLVIAGGVAVTVAATLALRRVDWPIYVAFLLLSLVLFGPGVEVLPGLMLPMPGLALCIGFLYVGGLPIILLRNAAPPYLTQLLRWTLPKRWRVLVPDIVWRGPGLFSVHLLRVEGARDRTT